MSKFVDIIPSKFSEVVTSLKVSEKPQEYELPGLYGLLINFEEIKERQKINDQRIAKDPHAALVATSVQNRELFLRVDYHLIAHDQLIEDEEEDEDIESLQRQLALLVQKIETKKASKFRSKQMFDSKKVSCYRCGKPCHIAAECKVKTAKTSQVDKVAERAKMYRQ